MHEAEYIENKGELMDTAQDNILHIIDSPPKAIKSFSAAQALHALNADFFGEAACRQWILKTLHPDGAFCPHCQSAVSNISAAKFWNMQYMACRACGKRSLATKGTILHNSSLSMRQAFALACLIALGLSNKQIAEIVGIHPDSVRLWRLRLNG